MERRAGAGYGGGMHRDDDWRPQSDLLAAIHEVYQEFDRCQYRELAGWDSSAADEWLDFRSQGEFSYFVRPRHARRGQ